MIDRPAPREDRLNYARLLPPPTGFVSARRDDRESNLREAADAYGLVAVIDSFVAFLLPIGRHYDELYDELSHGPKVAARPWIETPCQ